MEITTNTKMKLLVLALSGVVAIFAFISLVPRSDGATLTVGAIRDKQAILEQEVIDLKPHYTEWEAKRAEAVTEITKITNAANDKRLAIADLETQAQALLNGESKK